MKTTIDRDRKVVSDKIHEAGPTGPGRASKADHLHAGQVQRLHRAIGNQAVQRVLAQQLAAQEILQRDQDGGTAPADDGVVTIQPVQPEPYDVTGTTLAQVSEQLDPTEWGRCRYEYEYSYETTNGRTTKVDVTLMLTVRLPRWQGQGWDDASEAAKAEWRRMMRALEAHEEGHAEIARQWAPTVKERLLNQREGNVEQRYNQVFVQVRAEQDDYDDRTHHGQTQGVSLDLSIE